MVHPIAEPDSGAYERLPTMKFHYTRVRVYPDLTGRYVDLPGISRDGVNVDVLTDYFETVYPGKLELPTLKEIREVVRRFLDYTAVHAPSRHFGSPIQTQTDPSAYEYFSRFAGALLHGTFGTESGRDNSDLGWRPLPSRKVNRMIYHLTNLFDWVASARLSSAKTAFNPETIAVGHDRIMIRAAYEFRRSRSMLGHTWAHEASNTTRAIARNRVAGARTQAPAEFPNEHFKALLQDGFFIAGRHNIRDILITLLLDGAGFRESEPFHLYVQDVCMDPANPGVALVRIFHPSEGDAPNDPALRGRKVKRQEYLQIRYGLTPRTHHLAGRVGEKGGKYDDRSLYKQAHWFPMSYGAEFWRLWQVYLRQIALIPRNHPYAFISFHKNYLGQPYSLDSYDEAHQKAVYRAGIAPKGAIGLKASGLTRHGHRHAYAQRHKRCGTEEKYLQIFLKHSSIESQQIYTQASSIEISEALRLAHEKLGQEQSFSLTLAP